MPMSKVAACETEAYGDIICYAGCNQISAESIQKPRGVNAKH